MNYFHMLVTVEQDKNEVAFADREKREPAPGLYSYVVRISESDNIQSVLDGIGGLKHANLFPTKKRAWQVAQFWNECYKNNGTYLFGCPNF